MNGLQGKQGYNMDYDDFIAILTPPAQTFPPVKVGAMANYDPLEPTRYDYYQNSSLFYEAKALSAPDFIVAKKTNELCGIIYLFEPESLGLLQSLTSSLDKRTYCITMPGSPSMKDKTRICNPTPRDLVVPQEHLGAFEIIWSRQEDTCVYAFSDFFGLEWLFKVKNDDHVFSGIILTWYKTRLQSSGLIFPSSEKLLF
jgi:hypothetical protein